MPDLPDHPVIRNLERTGYPDGKDPRYPKCPVCGEECETVYKTKDYEIVGCNLCLRPSMPGSAPSASSERSEKND